MTLQKNSEIFSYLPFTYFYNFPMELYFERLTTEQIYQGLAVQLVWIIIFMVSRRSFGAKGQEITRVWAYNFVTIIKHNCYIKFTPLRKTVSHRALFLTTSVLSFSSRRYVSFNVIFYQSYQNAVAIGLSTTIKDLISYFSHRHDRFMFFIKFLNLQSISEGKLDIILTKPVDSQFCITEYFPDLLFSVLPPLVH